MAGMVTMIRGIAAGTAVGTAAGMIRGSTVRRVIGVTARPSASAGAGVVSMPATGGRPGAGGRVIGVPVIGAVVTGVVIGDITTTTIIMQPRITARMQAVRPLMQIVIGEAVAEIRSIGSLREAVMKDRLPL